MQTAILQILHTLREAKDSYTISNAELELLDRLERGPFSIKSIAEDLCRSPRTVENQLQSIYRKLGVHSKEELLKRLWKADEQEILIACRF